MVRGAALLGAAPLSRAAAVRPRPGPRTVWPWEWGGHAGTGPVLDIPRVFLGPMGEVTVDQVRLIGDQGTGSGLLCL